jgi:hypothetical protein
MLSWHSLASSGIHIQVKKGVKAMEAAPTISAINNNNKVVHSVLQHQQQQLTTARLSILKPSRRSTHGCSK